MSKIASTNSPVSKSSPRPSPKAKKCRRHNVPTPIVHLDMEIPTLMLWVKEEPFTFGILTPTPTSKIGLNMLRKVAEYCRDREGFYPKIRYEQWKHVSKRKLNLPCELSWSFLRAFDILKRAIDPGSNLKLKDRLDIEMENIRTNSFDPEEELSVDTLKFLIFLYIQNFYKVMESRKYEAAARKGKNVAQLFEDHWPVEMVKEVQQEGKSSKPGTPPNTTPVGSKFYRKRKPLPEQSHASFVETNIDEIVDFLHLVFVKKSKKDEQHSSADTRTPIEVVSALSLILGSASVKGNPIDTEFSTLAECVMAVPEVATAVDFVQDGQNKNASVDKQRLIQWVRCNLKMNPWGPSSTPVPQQGVSYRTGIWENTNAFDNNRVYWNTQLYPKGWYLISTVNSQVFHVDTLQLLSSLKVHRCSNSYIYIPCTLNSILIEKCDNCTLYFGPAAKFVKFVNCSNLRVSAVGRMFILEDVVNSTFNIATPTHPIICGSKAKDIVLGPYNTFYPKLERHMDMVGLGVKILKGDRPLELDKNGVLSSKIRNPDTPAAGTRQVSAYSILKPENFTKIIYPFTMDGSSFQNPCELPRSYAKQTAFLNGAELAYMMQIRKANINERQRNQLNAVVQLRFHNWLKEKGHLDQLRGLRSLQKTVVEGSTSPILETRKSIHKEKKRLNSTGTTGSINAADGDSSSNGVILPSGEIMATSSGFFTSDPSSDKVTSQEVTDTGTEGPPQPNQGHVLKSRNSSSTSSDGLCAGCKNNSHSGSDDDVFTSDNKKIISFGGKWRTLESIYFSGSSGDESDPDTEPFPDEDDDHGDDGEKREKKTSSSSSSNGFYVDDGLNWNPV